MENLSKIEQVLKSLRSDDEFIEFLNESSLFTDELSLKLFKRIASPHSAFSVTDLPKLTTSKFRQDMALVRLYQLEDLGLFTSKLVRKCNDYLRVFEATPLGTKLARIIAGKK